MPARKHDYQIIINEFHDDPQEEHFSCQYKYQNISGIRLEIAPKGVRISFSSGQKYTSADLLSYGRFNLVPDAVKKALLLHLMKYSEELSVTNARVFIDGKEETADSENKTIGAKDKPFIHTLIDTPLVRAFPGDQWLTPSVVESILKFTKSTQDGRIAALYALLCSKTKKHEVESFIYLWMSFNGLYGYLSKVTEDMVSLNKGKRPRISDAEGIMLLLALYGIAKERVVGKDSRRIAQKVIEDLKQWDGVPITRESLENGRHQTLGLLIESHLQKTDKDNNETPIDVSAYGYLLGFFAYHFRCTMIHADKPIPLYSYESENELKSLRIINNLLEDFLDQNLSRYFDSSYTDADKDQDGLKKEIDQVLNDPNITVKNFKW